MRYRNCSADDAGFVELGGWVCGRCGCSNQGSCCTHCGWAYRTGGGVVKCGGHDGCGCSETRTAQCCADNLQIRGRSGSCSCSETRAAQCCNDNLQARSRSGDCTQTRRSSCSGAQETNVRSSEGMLCFCMQNDCNDTARTGNARQDDDCAYRNRRTDSGYGCRTCNQADEANGNGRGCCQDGGAAYGGRNSRSRALGMVYAEEQELKHIYESESALQAGTLFPELHKPLNGYCPTGRCCGTDAQEAAFAAWELRLYLNTHPDDCEAKRLFRKLCEETEEPNYATSFLGNCCASGDWNWGDDPWPWETCANRCK